MEGGGGGTDQLQRCVSPLQSNGTRWKFTGGTQRDKNRHLKKAQQQRLSPEIMTGLFVLTNTHTRTRTARWQQLPAGTALSLHRGKCASSHRQEAKSVVEK